MPSNSKLIAELMNNSATISTSAIPNGSGVSIGTIIPFGGTAAPSGFLACDGSAISRTTYADLFSAISTTWGTGDGSTTFNIPDLRDRFIRGSGTSRAVATAENHAMPSANILGKQTYGSYGEEGDIIHFRAPGASVWNPGGGGEYTLGTSGKVSGGPNSTGANWINRMKTEQLTANEVRPSNKATLYCIKF